MADKPAAAEHENRVNEVLAEYMLRLDAGERIDRQRLLAAHPELRDELAAYLQAEDELARAVEDLRPTLLEALGLWGSKPGSGRHAVTQVGDSLPPTQPADPGQAASFQLDGFQILGQIGRGGMGIVYRAVQQRLNREVALKVLPPALAADADRLQRFRNEAALAAAVNESHILPVYDIVEADGVPVLVLPYVDGCDLGRLFHDRKAWLAGDCDPRAHAWAKLDDQEYLQKILPVLDMLVDAVASLHAADILHRDIKPSNLLIDRRGNVWLTDFGLARLGAQSGLTRPGAAVGTAGFMSPEQAQGASDLDGRTDVFGAGATIYQALTLETPYGKEVIHEKQALPSPPSRRQKLVSRDFDGVVLKALEPDRSDRYASAADLQADWRRVRQGLMPRARAGGRLSRSWRWVRRNPWPIATGVLAATLLVALFALAPERHASVYLPTEPPGTVGIMVPLNETTGQLQPEWAVRSSPWQGKGLVFANVPPGDYLVEVEASGRAFHEVYRHVPTADEEEPLGSFAHQRWRRQSRRAIQLEVVVVPEPSVIDSMVFLPGGKFTAGSEELPPFVAPPFECEIAAFHMDPTEVPLAEFRKQRFAPVPSSGVGDRVPRDDEAVSYVTYDEALAYAEWVGKRLPNELEYEFAATGGGKHDFPWGDSTEPIRDWLYSEIGSPAIDRVIEHPSLAGLYSNVAEWTTSWLTPYPSAPADAIRFLPKEHLVCRVVRGGPYSVVVGKPDRVDIDFGPRLRHEVDRSSRHPGLGFRCARSQRPRYLHSQP
ncbi:MAG: bifunctional serine/threonine-protein kinase/formylglycine-generating enzyme family protein [Pirellulales bacterium]